MSATTTSLDFPLCLGITKEEENILIRKASVLSREILLNSMSNSGIAQKLKETFSYNEVIYFASIFIMKETEEIMTKDPLIISVLELVKLIKRLKKQEDNEENL